MLQTNQAKSTKLSLDLLTENQDACLTRLFETDATLVVAEMGFGKTIVCLSAIKELLDEQVIKRVLILAPLKVCRTVWQTEASKWQHTSDLSIALAIGTAVKRVNAIKSDAKIVLMNYENVPWFCDEFKDTHGFDALICDEITKLKSSGGVGFKKLRHRLKDFKWRVGLSGTPVSEDFEGLYAMSMILDGGKRLGTRKDVFLRNYFYPTDYKEYNWALIDKTGKTLLNKISDLLFIADNETYKQSLPPIFYHTEFVTLPSAAQIIYDDMKNDAIALGVTAVNAAVVVGKLLQIANGFLYGDEEQGTDTVRLHDAKMDKILELIIKIRSPLHSKKGSVTTPIIIAYWFKHDLETLLTFLPNAKVMAGANDIKTIEDWNAGLIPILLIQPRSAGHGIQLQKGGSNLIWLGPVWSRDLVLQTEARIHRQGQQDAVNVYTIACKKTIDLEVLNRVKNKGGYAELLTAHLG
tara:strand:- start:1250 stop:2647 length:1398 start_codon:yes stop_codon:yes gene_type:complete